MSSSACTSALATGLLAGAALGYTACYYLMTGSLAGIASLPSGGAKPVKKGETRGRARGRRCFQDGACVFFFFFFFFWLGFSLQTQEGGRAHTRAHPPLRSPAGTLQDMDAPPRPGGAGTGRDDFEVRGRRSQPRRWAGGRPR